MKLAVSAQPKPIAHLHEQLGAALAGPLNAKAYGTICRAVAQLDAHAPVSLALVENLEMPAAQRAALVLELFRKSYPREVASAEKVAGTLAETWAALADSPALDGFLSSLLTMPESGPRVGDAELVLREALGTTGEMDLTRLNAIIAESLNDAPGKTKDASTKSDAVATTASSCRPSEAGDAEARTALEQLAAGSAREADVGDALRYGLDQGLITPRELKAARRAGAKTGFVPTLEAIAKGDTPMSQDLLATLKAAIKDKRTNTPAVIAALVDAQAAVSQLLDNLRDAEEKLKKADKSTFNDELWTRGEELLAVLTEGQPLLKCEERELNDAVSYAGISLEKIKEAVGNGSDALKKARAKKESRRDDTDYFKRYGANLAKRIVKRDEAKAYLAGAIAWGNSSFVEKARPYINSGVLSRHDVNHVVRSAETDVERRYHLVAGRSERESSALYVQLQSLKRLATQLEHL